MSQQEYDTCIDACIGARPLAITALSPAWRNAIRNRFHVGIGLDIDCAEICRLAAGFVARNGEFKPHQHQRRARTQLV